MSRPRRRTVRMMPVLPFFPATYVEDGAIGAIYRATKEQRIRKVMGRGREKGVYELQAYSWFPDRITAYVDKLEAEGLTVRVSSFAEAVKRGQDLADNGTWVKVAEAPTPPKKRSLRSRARGKVASAVKGLRRGAR